MNSAAIKLVVGATWATGALLARPAFSAGESLTNTHLYSWTERVDSRARKVSTATAIRSAVSSLYPRRA